MKMHKKLTKLLKQLCVVGLDLRKFLNDISRTLSSINLMKKTYFGSRNTWVQLIHILEIATLSSIKLMKKTYFANRTTLFN
jgi:hypothetical protein